MAKSGIKKSSYPREEESWTGRGEAGQALLKKLDTKLDRHFEVKRRSWTGTFEEKKLGTKLDRHFDEAGQAL